MMRTLVLALAMVWLVGCSGTRNENRPAPAAPRSPQLDKHCSDAARPHAYDYGDQDTAEAAGCKVVRVYGGVLDEKTGEMMDSEVWVFCCPER